MTPAADLNRSIIELCTYRDAFVWRNNTGRRGGVSYGHPGSGDIIGVYRGYFISIETKTPRDTARPGQIRFAQDIVAHGGFACFARDLDDVIEFLERIDEHDKERDGEQSIPF